MHGWNVSAVIGRKDSFRRILQYNWHYGSHLITPWEWDTNSKLVSLLLHHNAEESFEWQSSNEWNHPRNVFMKNVEGNTVTKFLQPISFFFSIIRQLAPLNYHILGGRQVCILTGSSTHSLFLITVVSAWRHTCTSTYLSSNRISVSQNREASAQEQGQGSRSRD